jgi:hypothetical protein
MGEAIAFVLGLWVGVAVMALIYRPKLRAFKNKLDIVNRQNINLFAKLTQLTDRDKRGRFVKREKRGW